MMNRSRALVSATVARFIVAALFFDSLAPLFPLIARGQGLSDGAFQALLGACFLAFAAGQLLSVPVIRKVGLYRPAGLSCLYLGVGTGLICTTDIPALFAVLFVSLFAVNSVGSNATRVALRNETSDEGFRRLFAWASSFVELMQIGTPLLAGALAALFGWRWAMVALVAPVVLAGLALEGSTLRTRPDHRRKDASPGGGPWRAILMRRTFLIPALTAAALQIAFAPVLARLPFAAAQDLDLGPIGIGVMIGFDSVVVALGLFLCGLLTKRLSTRSKVVAGCSVLLAGFTLMATSPWTGPWPGVAGMLVATAAFGFIYIPCAGEALNVPEADRVTTSALFGVIQPVSAGVAVGLGSLAPLSHIAGAALMTGAALVPLLGLVALWAPRPEPAPPA